MASLQALRPASRPLVRCFHHARTYTTGPPAPKRVSRPPAPESGPSHVFYGPDADIEPFLRAWRPSDARAEAAWYNVYRKYEEFDNPAHQLREREVRERATPPWEALKVDCRRIKREAPARSNKKLGTRSQKDLRADAHHRFSQDVMGICEEVGYTGGRWVCSLNPAKVDDAWGRVAKAVGTRGGALFDSSCAEARVSARPSAPSGHFESTWSLVLLCQNSYDRAAVGDVARALVGLGVQPGYYKTDASSLLRILAKNEAQLEPALYKGKDFVAPDATGPTWMRRNARVAVAGGLV